jgi:hypothetical protein
LVKSVIQQRANQLVRELHQLEESEETMRMLHERRNRSASKKQGYDSLADTGKSHARGGGGVQTGMRSFFTSTKSVSKKETVVILSDDEEEKSNSLGKRKSTGDANGLEPSSPEKKFRKSTG